MHFSFLSNPSFSKTHLSFPKMATKSAASVVDWSKIYTGLGLDKQTLTSLQSFRARHSAALNKNSALKATTPSIDLSHYKSVLKDQQAVQLAEKVLGDFKPVDYDVSKWNGVVEAFEGKAIAAAKETVSKISTEEASLQATLSNIKDARPFEDLTVDEVAKARPEIAKAVETMVKKGKWSVPGYREKFGDLSLM
ncbi:F-type H+-transporting ATPase subunit D [Cryptococcus gattii Ru294]|uniref:ATP synthase subunit d, mitochondrial n=6 Tax=Cryptococcus gattii species complex TaxID=1884637 RepID=A0A0D0UYF4_9TREE|nr:Subunit d of the stator stalk of mitochondrial F1F0 ATP synthase required for ATP synthesis, putative; Atp7p [Cryptococcus gattii WM276]KIR28791.1 F-type H+-transporting ATPase subunit D [Cryptococcus deuterogattii LA55]KIR32857.1 F-type H+-transporting ATPase subunit D [Cryptococcus deuterogattii MMRL2647]KIR39214.1 F-type H+-transporting ATPase subunit D [Cryptococcus deuterogattii Ram5]KIR46636.1 F-type H+-transporting ATPase subunit D [Cryptococcus bacillisporus CA1280]KIR54185.1 F-type|eukprot:KIR59826.1 F-type H+-transporting ATPase subunit D [Cryptococcus gattii CA1873]